MPHGFTEEDWKVLPEVTKQAIAGEERKHPVEEHMRQYVTTGEWPGSEKQRKQRSFRSYVRGEGFQGQEGQAEEEIPKSPGTGAEKAPTVAPESRELAGQGKESESASAGKATKRSGVPRPGSLGHFINMAKEMAGFSPGDLGMAGIAKQMRESAEAQAEAKKFASGQMQEALSETGEQLADVGREYDPRQEQVERDTATAISGVKDLQQQHMDAGIDPTRWFKTNKGWAIAGALLGAMGQFLQARTGRDAGPNLGLKAIENAVEADIQAQTAELKKLGMQVNMQYNLVAQYRQQGLSLQAAEDAARHELIQGLKFKLEGIAKTTEGKLIDAQLQETLANIDQTALLAEEKYKASIRKDKLAAVRAGMTGAYQQGQLYNARQQIAMMQKKASAAGVDLPVAAKNKVMQIRKAQGLAELMQKEWAERKAGRWSPVTSGLAGMLPAGTEAGSFEAVMNYYAGQIGRSTNLGERFTEDDEARWQGYVPRGNDSDHLGDRKMESLFKNIDVNSNAIYDVYVLGKIAPQGISIKKQKKTVF